MEYFYSGGGNNRPSFPYSFLVKKITDEMYNWCGEYPLDGPFERWHIIHNYQTTYTGNANTGQGDRAETPLIQFESRKAAYLFSIAYSEYIIENKSVYDLVAQKHQ